jgi:hypothetical protein
MKKLIMTFLLFSLLCFPVYAQPIIVDSSINPNTITTLTKVLSRPKMDLYIPDDMINFNLFNTKYPYNGNFSFVVYMELKSEEFRQENVKFLKEDMDKGQIQTIGRTYPDLLKCIANQMYFDIQNNRIEIRKDIYIDQDGVIIGMKNNSGAVIDLNEDRPLLIELTKNIASILEREKNYPKNADIISDIWGR